VLNGNRGIRQVNVEDALNELLGEDRTDDLKRDLIRAARESMRRRKVNSLAGGAVIAALHHDEGLSFRDIEQLTGIPVATAHGWAAPPRSVDE
jgi:hypothetical protein